MSDFPAKILLATDGSKDAVLAARVAADLSNGFGAELYAVHAWQADFPRAYEITMPMALMDWCEEKAGEMLAKQVKRIQDDGAVVAEAHLVMGPPVDVILDLCEELEVGLVVMGSRGLGAVRRIFVGSVSEGVVHHACCPVLVVRGGEESWPPNRVVAGDDGSEAAGQAAELAARVGKLFGAPVTLVRAHPEIPALPGLPEHEEGAYRRLVEEDRRRGLKALEERARELDEVLDAPAAHRLLAGDEAAAAILEVAEGEASTLVAVGSRGLGPVKRARLGSVATKVLRAARGPVLLCPPPHSQKSA